MDDDENILRTLAPAFHASLSEREVDKLSATLKKGKYISEGDSNSLSNYKGREKIESIFNAIISVSKKGWQFHLIGSLGALFDKSELERILECSIGVDKNKHVLWILRSWDDLMKQKKAVDGVLWMITTKKVNSENWLFQFCHLIASFESDSELANQVVSTLQQEISSISSSSLMSSYDEYSMPSQTPLPGSFSDSSDSSDSSSSEKEIDQYLGPILPSMVECLTNNHTMKIARHLFNAAKLTKQTLKTIKAVKSADKTGKEAIRQFYWTWKFNAGNDWKESLLNAMSTIDEITPFYEVMKEHLKRNNEQLMFLLQNWNDLKDRQSLIYQVAHDMRLVDMSESLPTNWLLAIIHKVLMEGSEALTSFTYLVKQQSKKPDIAQGEETSSLKQQAITKEFVGPDQVSSREFTSGDGDLTDKSEKSSKQFSQNEETTPNETEEISTSHASENSVSPHSQSMDHDGASHSNVDKEFDRLATKRSIEAESSAFEDQANQKHSIENESPATEPEITEERAMPAECPRTTIQGSIPTSDESKDQANQESSIEMESPTPEPTEKKHNRNVELAETIQTETKQNPSIVPPANTQPPSVSADPPIQQEIPRDEFQDNVDMDVDEDFEVVHQSEIVMAKKHTENESKKRQNFDVQSNQAVKLIKVADGTKGTDSSFQSNLKPSVSYAGALKKDGKKATSELRSSLPTKPNIKVSPITTVEDYSMNYFKKLVSENKYLLEFRAIVDVEVPKDALLCVYLVGQQTYFPMHYDADIEAYRFMLDMNSTRNTDVVYKYCIARGQKIEDWESLPFGFSLDGLINRKVDVQYDQRQRGHAILLDVVSMKRLNKDQYQTLYNENLPEFLPRKPLKLDTSDACFKVHQLFLQWLINAENGVTTWKNYYTHKVVFNRKKDSIIQSYLAHINETMTNSPDIECHVKRVLCTLALVMAMERKFVKFDEMLLVGVCNGLSLHDIDEKNQLTLENHLRQFAEMWGFWKSRVTGSRSFADVFDAVCKNVLDIPECLLVFPLLKVFQIMLDPNSSGTSQPRMPSRCRWQDILQKLRNKKNSRHKLQMAEAISNLQKIFPWISKMYSEMLNPEEVAKLLFAKSQFANVLDDDLVFQKLIHFWKQATKPYSYEDFNEETAVALFSYLTKEIHSFTDHLHAEKNVTDADVVKLKHWFDHSKKLLSLIEKHVGQDAECSIPLILYSLTLFDILLDAAQLVYKKKDSVTLKRKIEDTHNTLLNLCSSCIFESHSSKNNDHTVKLWNTLCDFRWNTKDFEMMWIDVCRYALTKHLSERFDEDGKALLQFYAEEFDTFKPTKLVADSFADSATKFIQESLLGPKSYWKNAKSKVAELTGLKSYKVLKLCFNIFEKQWESVCIQEPRRRSGENAFLDLLDKWTSASTFLRILYNENLTNQLSVEQGQFLEAIALSVYNTVYTLRCGTTFIRILRRLNDVQKHFLESYEAILQDSKSSSVDHKVLSKKSLNDLIELRVAEMMTFYDIRSSIQAFKHFTKILRNAGLNVDIDELLKKVNEDVSNLSLTEVVTCTKFKDNQPVDQNTAHHVTFFALSEETIEFMKEIKQGLTSEVVIQMLSATANNIGKDMLTIQEAIQEVWLPTKNQITEMIQQLNDETIQLQALSVMFESIVMTSGIDNIFQEVKLLYKIQQKPFNNEVVEKRIDQINNYFLLRRHVQTALILDLLREKLNLEGDFNALRVPLDIGQQVAEKDLKTITETMFELTAVLDTITEEQLNILQTFAQSKLIEWLKTNMKSIGEVKVMSDLAMISAGETPMEVDRVSCFLSAVMGFAPLLFELPQESGLKELLDACLQLWKNVDRDPALLKNWIETDAHMGWLDVVKEFHGSVGKSSLTRAQQINTCGVYKIGQEIKRKGDATKIPLVEDCLKLLVQQKEDEDDIIMTLSELHDLQSRLMLIAGEAEKGREDVNKFIDTLACVENLTKSYVKLKTSGCLLFSNWKAVIRCTNDDSNQNVTVQIFFDDSSPAISSSESVINEVKSLTNVLDQAHQQWMGYLTEKRNEHYHLNHFNIHQLMYLCKQLANEDIDGFPDQIYTLLASVSENATFETITDCLDEATKIKDDAQEEISMICDDEANVSKIQKKKKMVRKLVQLELAENVAKAAVQAVKSLDVDDCYLWGLENEFEEEKITKLQRSFDEEAGFEANGANINVVQNVMNDRSNLTLEEVIRRIQENLEDDDHGNVGVTVKTICERYLKGTAVTSLDDCVSLEHLGQFLTTLGMTGGRNNLPQRNYPEQFLCGKPNLIVCPRPDIWKMIISIYMTSPEQGLPSATEVLVCNSATTSEDVELLLRRALTTPLDEGNRIYCLACADELPFKVAKETEENYQQLLQMPGKNEEFKLVILTSSQQHYITSCFDEHQINGFVSFDDNKMKKYLKKQLCVKTFTGETAAKFDRDQSSVRIIQSENAGMGKSLFVTRCREALEDKFMDTVYWNSSTIRFLEKVVDVDDIVDSLYYPTQGEPVSNQDPHFVHIDITPSVETGVYKALFDLLILGSIQNSYGFIWRHRQQHFYAIEYTRSSVKGVSSFANLLDLLPFVNCLSPLEVKDFLKNHPEDSNPSYNVLMDSVMLRNESYQRPYQYLMCYANRENLDNFSYKKTRNNALECLETLLRFCSIEDPSWSELSHFSKFLNTQLHDCEKSVFCDINLVGADTNLVGFKQFVVRFMIRMSQDFATPSLKIDDDHEMHVDGENDLFELHQLRRRWESGFHPYLFFNDDRASMSFVHFNVNRNGALCHPKTNEVVEEKLMPTNLVTGLHANRVKLQQDFDKLKRSDKLETLCRVFGVSKVFDPDPTYELTTDNVLKMLAIHMRFRCGIPVVVMGETGCGKTRMVEFMCKLKAGGKENLRNMVIVKVHGGITVSNIQEKVREAVQLARENKEKGGIETILFLDEANTTEAIYAIKEVVCDGTVHGIPFTDVGLKIVAACNPYRKHTDEVIASMEKAGLGFHVKAENTADKFAGIPMRQLVYRVISLPPSMQPLVWDFGQLNNETESIYIKQMVIKLVNDICADEDVQDLPNEMTDVISSCLSASQQYMRQKRDMCSFVSLRDVERTIESYMWFYKHLDILNPLIAKHKPKKGKKNIPSSYQALIHSLGMCYHATLNERKVYRQELVKKFTSIGKLQITENDILEEIIACQDVFINAIQLDKDIARNEALRENVFMMVMCSEMRIPLFLVGKPGSSKSLAKTIVTDAMQGRNSRSELFQQLKQIQILSFQCSAISDAVGIETVFSQCTQLQKKQDLQKYVAVVVLDEIGLAEDSKKMPLKVLHPLLETASTNSRLVAEPHYKVGFVGISNWALDPAKMNRGIFVTRGEPSKEDLQETAEAIFESDETTVEEMSNVIKAVTNAYLEIYRPQEREFFGLRDYYGLLKMIFAILREQEVLEYQDIAKSVLRNFNGYTEDVMETFNKHFFNVFPHVYSPNISVTELIHENLNSEYESRFLLLLTKQYSAVSLLHKVMGDIQDFQVIFGSSFPHDHDYTEVCRNINRIKVCMESGRAVVLLNLRDLYESLYDALNQHYVTFADQRYIDLGLGGHRVKCRVAKGFRLIVIEEKDIVYNEFPIPLINRLEKYVFEMSSVLSPHEASLVNRLKEWLLMFSKIRLNKYQRNSFTEEDTFAGYKDDTPASALLSIKSKDQDKYDLARKVLLDTASLDGVCRLPKSGLYRESEKIRKIYMEEQEHDTLHEKLKKELTYRNQLRIFEVTSYSQVLNEKDRKTLERILELEDNRIMLMTLQQFQTEQEYSTRLDEFFEFAFGHAHNENVDDVAHSSFILLIQCSHAHLHGNLIACAKYSAMNKVKQLKKTYPKLTSTIIVAFLFTMERHTVSVKHKESFTSFHSQDCASVYIDELRPAKDNIAPVSKLWGMSVADVLKEGIKTLSDTDQLINLHQLIYDCLPDAMAKLKSQTGLQGRNRVRIMNELCFNHQLSKPFIQILLHRIFGMMQDRELKLVEEGGDKDSWIVEEACSATSLQEGGSFRNTLWLRLRRIIAIAIAKIVSVADVDNNFDLLVETNEDNLKFADVWFQIFASGELLHLHWSNVLQNADFVIERKLNFSCQFPFSRIIFEKMYSLWMVIQENRDKENKKQTFEEKIFNSDVHGYLSMAVDLSNMVAVKKFVHDLVHWMYKSQTQDTNFGLEFEVVQDCIIGMFSAQRRKSENHCNALVEVFTIFMENLSNLQQFSEVIAVHSDILGDRQTWIDEQSKTYEFIVHRLAFSTLLKHLHSSAPKDMGSLETCKQWKSLVVQTKNVADTLVPGSSDEIVQSWKQIVFVEIFLDQLIPASAVQETTQHYLTTLAPLARRLWMGASKLKDLSNLQFLKIITKTLQGCTQDIQLRLLCSWNDVKCKSCKEKLKDPVLLPCKHYVCHKCIPIDGPETSCPICRVKIADPNSLRPIRMTVEQRKEMETFNSACTSFFLEYLSTFCFPPPQAVAEKRHEPPPDENITLALEKLVICDNNTRDMSPLLSNYDTNPTARSYILQLLLRCDNNLVENQLNVHFQKMGIVLNDKSILMGIYIQCMQDMLQRQSYFNNEEEKLNAMFAQNLLKECLEASKRANNFTQLQHLNLSAKLQFIARITVSCVIRLENKQARHFQDYQQMLWLIGNVLKVCCDPKFVVMKQYIIKYLCRRHGMDYFNVLLNNKTYRPLVPQNLIPVQDDAEEDFYLQSDSLVLSGKSYVKTKSLLMDIAQDADLPKVFQQIVHEIQQSPDSIIQILLALSVWRGQGDNENALRETTFHNIIGQLQMHLAGRINQQFFNDIAKGSLQTYKLNDATSQVQYKLIELITVFGTTLLCSEEVLLANLVGLITNPNQLLQAFLPTMAESIFFKIKAIIQQEKWNKTTPPKAYLCPNKHIYFIGECTNPVQAGICPECHQKIGGQKYGELQPGNDESEITEASQAGYKLGIADNRAPVTPERKLTKLSVCVTRICLHVAMLLGSRNGNYIKEMINIQGDQSDVNQFLLQHINKDLVEFSQLLGRSIDDAFILMHQIFHRMRTTNVAGLQRNYSWQTMAAREVWEEEFQRHYLSLIFKDTDAVVNKAQNTLIEAGKLSEKPLQNLVYELRLNDDIPNGIVEWNCPHLWKYRVQVDMQHLRQKLEAVDTTVGGEGSMLKAILSVENLELLQHLPTLLSLQAAFITKYRQKIDMNDADETTLQDFILDEENNFFYEDDINLYIKIWNKVRHLLVNSDRYNTSRQFFKESMSLESPIAMCLPSRRGRGCCALVLVEYFINMQNNILHQCRELVTPRPTFVTMDAPKCTKRNIICIDEERDLMPLVLANSQYETSTDESGSKHKITYNIVLLEKKILEKFVLRKVEINRETVPRMQYPQDMGLANDYKTVVDNSEYKQMPLPIRMCQDIDALVENETTANICQVVRTITLVIQFLAKLGGEANQTICDYAEKDLLLPADETEMIPRSAQLRHCLALYERLSWHRSKRMIQNGQNPFENVINIAEDIKDDDVIQTLREELATINTEKLQLELNALLMVGPEMNADWSLGEEVLVSYLEAKYDDCDTSWCEKIPSEVLYKSAVHVFRLSIDYLAN